MSSNNQQNPTPSSEIIHLVSTFVDTLDSLPPSLTRSLSDLKELDAVLSGSLQSITTKLQLLLTMMNSPPPGTILEPNAIVYTPFERLKLLREVAEDARVFRLGGEDKIRVATGTCETIATHTSHLSTLSTLLLSFLPSHLLPMLPPPSAPHGYPSSITPSSALARRQIFDYPTTNHLGSGSTTRMQGALGMVREHWDMTRGGGSGSRAESSRTLATSGSGNSKRKPTMGMGMSNGLMEDRSEKLMMQTGSNGGSNGHGMLTGGSNHKSNSGRNNNNNNGGDLNEKDKDHRHPNQYTKKKSSSTNNNNSNNYSRFSQQGNNSTENIYSPNMSSNDFTTTTTGSSKDKRSRAIQDNGTSTSAGGAGGSASNTSNSTGGGTRGTGNTSASAGASGSLYPGMASQEEYNAATSGTSGGNGRTTKRKGDDSAATSKRRKKGPDHSPDPTPRSVPNPTIPSSASNSTSNSKAPRRSNSNNANAASRSTAPAIQEDTSALPLSNLGGASGAGLIEEEGGEVEGEEDGDGQTYCFCNRVSFGEMIGCDGSDCEREWFHLPCVGLQAIPKGQWFCTECQKKVRRRR